MKGEKIPGGEVTYIKYLPATPFKAVRSIF